ncbi:hypothetical protein [Streptomyces sp. NPDC096339]|uniref:hypothetical protein n=1 Tax=Streptomyces sp. NPDC096339 TaxID=3366086 RepID=UPI003811AC80
MRATKLGATMLLAGAAILCGANAATADTGPLDPSPNGFAIDAAAPVMAETTQLVGSMGAPLANTTVPCLAPWASQGLDINQQYSACNTGNVEMHN